jgi:PIN domain nuclease of toxin-antitoxin system
VGSRRTGPPLRPRPLLDTHILIRWLLEARKLSPTQSQALELAVRRSEPVALSAITLLETALLASGEKPALKVPLEALFQDLNTNPLFRILPLTYELAQDAAALGLPRDPAGRPIVATARPHRLIQSQPVQVLEQ